MDRTKNISTVLEEIESYLVRCGRGKVFNGKLLRLCSDRIDFATPTVLYEQISSDGLVRFGV